ncbi:MAG TPA: hypothetical protein VKV26_13040 [Dehalococcoidia bacterium]|nr:hypothetical protein [Dehalococcoidia bacterium]
MTYLLWAKLVPAAHAAARFADRGTGSLGWWADLWTVIAGVMFIVLGLVVFAIALAILFFGRKGMKAVHRLTNEKAVPALDRVRAINARVQERTAALPGAPHASGSVAQIAGAVQKVRETKPPFRSRKRGWIPFK